MDNTAGGGLLNKRSPLGLVLFYLSVGACGTTPATKYVAAVCLPAAGRLGRELVAALHARGFPLVHLV